MRPQIEHSVSQSREVNRCLRSFTEAMARCSCSLCCCMRHKHIAYTFTVTAHITPFANWKVEVKDSGFLARILFRYFNFFFFFFNFIVVFSRTMELPESIFGVMKCMSSRNTLILHFPDSLQCCRLPFPEKLHPACTEAPVWWKAAGLVIGDRSLTSPNDVRLETDTTAFAVKSLVISSFWNLPKYLLFQSTWDGESFTWQGEEGSAEAVTGLLWDPWEWHYRSLGKETQAGIPRTWPD